LAIPFPLSVTVNSFSPPSTKVTVIEVDSASIEFSMSSLIAKYDNFPTVGWPLYYFAGCYLIDRVLA